ncbi:hypothetical protein BVX98_06400 [bacterium F11]|nr:hypothetical protein BVX98_06400 [bacterium F11]
MMPNLKTIYDDTFFQEWGIEHQKYIESAKIITDILMNHLNPRRLIDLGCGCGVYSDSFFQKGVQIVSVDGVQPPQRFSFPVPIQVQDLTVPFKNLWGKFDVTLCLEVAEHIPEEFVDTFLSNLLQFGDLLVLSAAPPKQGGHHHVNEQPKRYWVQKCAQLGWIYNRKKTGKFIEDFKSRKAPYMWMGEHISFYQRALPNENKKKELPFSVRI